LVLKGAYFADELKKFFVDGLGAFQVVAFGLSVGGDGFDCAYADVVEGSVVHLYI
jgi:hypothetical protein